MANLPPAPIQADWGSYQWDEWFRIVTLRIEGVSAIAWDDIDFTTSNITDITTRNHDDLQNIDGGTGSEYYHLTSAEYTGIGTGPFLRQNSTLVSKSVDYTLVLTDSGKQFLHPATDASTRTFTIPANASVAFEPGTNIKFINQNGAGAITIAITSDTMRLASTGATGSQTLSANGVAHAIKLTATEWILYGVGLYDYIQ